MDKGEAAGSSPFSHSSLASCRNTPPKALSCWHVTYEGRRVQDFGRAVQGRIRAGLLRNPSNVATCTLWSAFLRMKKSLENAITNPDWLFAFLRGALESGTCPQRVLGALRQLTLLCAAKLPAELLSKQALGEP